jgi:hypothetical protein
MLGVLGVLAFKEESREVASTNEGPNEKADDSASDEPVGEGNQNDADIAKNDSLSPTPEEKRIISHQHKFFNKTAGWGAISSIEWINQKNNAEDLILALSETKKSDRLEADLFRVMQLAQLVADGEKDITLVLYLHRMFHDLDIEVNSYITKDYFGVTEIGEGNKVKAVTKIIEKSSKE